MMVRYTFPGTTFQFSYPETTPRRFPVALKETHRDNVSRVHLTSLDSRELYFEVTCYYALTAREGYDQLKEGMQERFGECTVTELQKTRLNGSPAFVFSFQCPFIHRKVYFLEKASATYRVLYDPTLPLNEQVLASVTVTD